MSHAVMVGALDEAARSSKAWRAPEDWVGRPRPYAIAITPTTTLAIAATVVVARFPNAGRRT